MSGPDRTQYKKLCAACAEKLRGLNFSVAELPDEGDKIRPCALCENRGYFSTYVVHSKRSDREDEG